MTKYNWKTDEKIKETIRNYLQEGKSYREIADILDTSYGTIEKTCIRYGLKKGIIINNTITAKQESKIGKDIIYLLKEELLKIPPKITANKIIKISADTAVIHFTDWHVGKVVKDEFGNEIYNISIFKQRIKKLLSEMLTLLDNYILKGTPIKDIVIISTGDILDGMGIYASQETKSELSPPFQVTLAAEIIRSFILSLLERKLPIKFYGVRGNHGEIRGEGGKAKDLNANWDLMLYLMLDWWAKDTMQNKDLEIYYSELDYMNITIQGWRFNIRHIAPLQTTTPSGKAKFLAWAKKHKIAGVVSGHYHQWNIGDRNGLIIIRGGSVPGQDDLSESMGEESEPRQLIWGVCKDRPLSFAYPVDLGGK